MRYGPDGERQATVGLSWPVLASTLDTERGRLWLATPRGVAAWNAAGERVTRLDNVHAPLVGAMAYGPVADSLWLAMPLGVDQIAAGDGSRKNELPAFGVSHLAADGAAGLWTLGLRRLKHFDADGNRRFVVRRPVHYGGAVDMTANPADQSLWLAGRHELIRFQSNGSEDFRERLPWRDAPGRVAALGLFADLLPPELTIEAPDEGALLANARPAMELEYTDAGSGVDPDSITIENARGELATECETTESGATCTPVNELAEGEHELTVTVADYAGNTSDAQQVGITVDTIPPEITFTGTLTPGFITNEPESRIQAEFNERATVTVDGEEIASQVWTIEHAVSLSEGTNSFIVTATDRAGNQSERTLTGELDTQPPSAPTASGLSVEVADGEATVTGAEDSVEAGASVRVTNQRTGETVTTQATEDGSFTATIEAQSGDTFTITARDKAGNTSDPTEVQAGGGGLPDNPEDVAPTLPENGASAMSGRVAFLYTGADPIQKGVASDTIEPRRVAVLSGSVRDRSGEPVSGVEISVLDHPEFGNTRTRDDGEFTMAVNGGGRVTVEYRKEGFLPVQRNLNPEWEDWVQADDVVLTPRTDKVTSIDLTSDEPMQVARGPGQSDNAGERQATLMFPQGTTAEITTPDGDTKQLSQLDVRATEYTVGDSGPEAMPGKLPPASAYTYAVNLSVDQALEQGVKVAGKDVRFNQAVPFYVDNFLDFPTGEAVPVGYYNNDSASWMPSDNGRIVEILNEQNGRAVLDVTGDGEPATDAELAELNLADAERARLAELYEPGDSLWRFTTTHLSNWDCNWPWEPPEDAEAPGPDIPDVRPIGGGSGEGCSKPGCTINAQEQSLGESIEIAGTPFELHYKSSRSEGGVQNSVTIPLTGDDLPSSLEAVKLEVDIAGRTVRKTFPPGKDQSYTFSWDGRDQFGRDVAGSADATIRIAYAYPCVYQSGSGGFGRPSGEVEAIGTRERCQGIDLARTSTVTLESPNFGGTAVGNWTLSAEHVLQENLFRGDNERRPLPDQIIKTVAGNGSPFYGGDGENAKETGIPSRNVEVAPDGSLYAVDVGGSVIFRIRPDGTVNTVAGNGGESFAGDGGPATEASLNWPRDVALGPNGGLYIADTSNNRIRYVTTEGTIQTVAGNGMEGYSGDGGPATEAALHWPSAVAVDNDGTLYIADSNNHRVRRVLSDGTIETVAGDGERGFSGDGGPAAQARINFPRALDVDDEGNLYIADSNNYRIRRVGPDGVIETVVGTGEQGYGGDGGPAEEAKLEYAVDIEIYGDNLYIADTNNNYIRRVGPAGIIQTIAGNGEWSFSGDNGPATKAAINWPWGIGVGPRGVFISDWYNDRIREVGRGGVTYTADGDKSFLSRSGERRFVFRDDGLIRRTEDADTGETLYSFARNDEGRLTAITDGDGETTTIERGPEGRATAIVAPDGQRTGLDVTDEGRLTAVHDPGGGSWSMDYTGDGLMTRFTDRADAINRFSYDERGRLIKDEGPKNSGWDIERTGGADDYSVSMTSGAGRESVFSVKRPQEGTRVYTDTVPDGTSQKRTYTDAGDTTVKRADGTTITQSEGPDPRFGMSAPVIENTTTETPSGLTRVVERSRTASVPEGNPLTEPQELTESVTVNGRTTESVFDGDSQTWTTTTAAGRESTRVIDDQGRPTETQVGPFAATQQQYDDRGRLSSATRTANGTTRETLFGYAQSGPDAGYLDSVTDPTGRTTKYERDANGRVLKQIRPDDKTVGFEYDEEGRLTKVDPPSQPAHVMDYDGNGSRTGYDPPDVDSETGVTRYLFNADEEITAIERPDGKTVNMSYAQGKRSSVTAPVGTWNYSYDSQTGRLAGIDSPGGQSLSFQRDGDLLTQTEWSGPVSGTVSRGYDDSFRLTEQTIGGQAISFGYDADSLLTSAGALSISRASNHSGITGTTLDTIATSRGYNAFGELSDRTAEAGNTALYEANYQRDRAGRLANETSSVQGTSATYGYNYDDAGRLTEVTAGGSVVHTYAYDDNGNRISHTGPNGTTTAEYDARDRLKRYGDMDYSYNAAGDLKSKIGPAGTTSYDYDALGNLRGVDLADGTEIEYVIDGKNRRVGKKVGGTLRKGWLYKDSLNPVAQTDGQGNVTHRFVYGDKPNVPAYMIKDGTTYRMISDHLGSVRLVVNASTGEVVQRMDYSPFGRVTTDTNPGLQPFGFAGGFYDPDTGLVRFGARDYDAETGRWTTRDPILFEGGQANLYGYVLNDPVNARDLAGLSEGSGSGSSLNRPGQTDQSGRTGRTGAPVSREGRAPPTRADKIGDAIAKQAVKRAVEAVTGVPKELLSRTNAVIMAVWPSSTGGCKAPGNCNDMVRPLNYEDYLVCE